MMMMMHGVVTGAGGSQLSSLVQQAVQHGVSLGGLACQIYIWVHKLGTILQHATLALIQTVADRTGLGQVSGLCGQQ